MKKLWIGIAVAVVLAVWIGLGFLNQDAKWSGVDESVVKKFAEEANRPPREPYINVGQGDMLLFFFLTAGFVGGFVAGYYYRELFPPRGDRARDSSHV